MSNKQPKRKAKDSLFTHLFADPVYLFKLYQALHKEDTKTTMEDIDHVTIENILVDDLYNDLGFCVKDKLIILVEAQSTWNVNIILRAALYLARTYQDYFNEKGWSLYGKKIKKLPEPEVYVLYTKDWKHKISEMTLQDEFFGGKDIAVNIRVKMLYGEPKDDIIGQYVLFTKILDKQIKIHEKTKKAVQETIRICKDKAILKDWLETKEGEVLDIYDYLYDEETIRKNYEGEIAAENRRKGINEGISIGRQDLLMQMIANGEISPSVAAKYTERTKVSDSAISRIVP